MRDLLLAVALVLGGNTLILASLLIAAGLTLTGLLVWRLWRGHREEVAYEAEMAPNVADQQAAVGRVAVPQPQWTRHTTPGPLDAHIAASLAHWALSQPRPVQVQADPGVCAVLSGEPTSCRLCLPHRCEYSPAERPLSAADRADIALDAAHARREDA